MATCRVSLIAGQMGGSSHHQYQLQHQDKRLQELRTFALEYVKLIVAKASEISEDSRHLVSEGSKHKPASLNGLQVSGRIRKAALQINSTFLFSDERSRLQTYLEPADAPGPEGRHAAEIGRPLAANTNINHSSGHEQEHQQCREKPAEPEATKRAPRYKLGRGLNWHLLVSCFSSCLPEALVETMPSGANGAPPPSRVSFT